jgi:sec-independent protein translocase protein TatA
LGGLQPWHWLIVIAVFVLLFGAKKLPDAARSLGKSMRIFKSEIKEMQSDSKQDTPSSDVAGRAAPTATPIASERADSTAAPAPEAVPPPDQRPA